MMTGRAAGSNRRRSFGLRALFGISVLLAIPFLVLANLVRESRPEDSIASPAYLVLGILGVLFFAAIGNALGGTKGTIAAAIIAGTTWLGVLLLGIEFSEELLIVLPLHLLALVTTITIITVVALRQKEGTGGASHETMQELIEVKRRVKTELQPPARDTKASSNDDPPSE